nr:hypothetical protein 4 [bacterium]
MFEAYIPKKFITKGNKNIMLQNKRTNKGYSALKANTEIKKVVGTIATSQNTVRSI